MELPQLRLIIQILYWEQEVKDADKEAAIFEIGFTINDKTNEVSVFVIWEKNKIHQLPAAERWSPMASYLIEAGLDFCLAEDNRNFVQQDSYTSLQVGGEKLGYHHHIFNKKCKKNETVFANLEFDTAH